MATTTPRRIVVDDTDPTIQYSTGWFVADPTKLNTLGNYGPVYNSSSHATSTSGSTLTFPFNGTSITVMGTIDITTDTTTNTTDPTWTCYVDEIPISNPNPTFAFPENNWPLCNLAAVAGGAHTLTIQVTSKGQPFYFDNLLYTPLPSVAQESAVLEYTNMDSSVSFGSGWAPWGAQNVTQTPGAQVALNFHGTSVSLFGYVPTELPHNASSASYTIDGGPPVNFALNGLPAQSATVYNTLFLTTNTLTPETHNLVVSYDGDSAETPLVVGSFFVTNVSTPSSSTTTTSASSTASADLSTTPAAATKSTPVGAIAGGIVGCVAVLALIVGLVFWCRRRRRSVAADTRRTSANPFTMAAAETLPASVAGAQYASTSSALYSSTGGAQYSYSAVGSQHARPETLGSSSMYPDAPGAGPAYPYMRPASPHPPTDAASSYGGASHAHNLSGSYTSGSDPPPGAGYPTPTPSETSRKYQRELAATAAFMNMPLAPLRASGPRAVVLRHHQDSGVRLNSASSLGVPLPEPEPEIVELPPGYSRE
ncbi:hypothetical protein DFH07DRAFT_301220 [Mycena maculata]|uniref:Transmembrane protein n=1 Tax=Mycena maculata TaxID=230809 RepID=A0AAD7JSQ8_9AGAR|nr:hypothetical protein DFH07DRAFT_301220 [Mycena maculata]